MVGAAVGAVVTVALVLPWLVAVQAAAVDRMDLVRQSKGWAICCVVY
jgi:hypothetical protein